jgi:hypothetical protein
MVGQQNSKILSTTVRLPHAPDTRGGMAQPSHGSPRSWKAQPSPAQPTAIPRPRSWADGFVERNQSNPSSRRARESRRPPPPDLQQVGAMALRHVARSVGVPALWQAPVPRASPLAGPTPLAYSFPSISLSNCLSFQSL